MACFKFHCLQIICTLIKMAYDASRRRRQLQKSRNAVAAEELTLEINIQLGAKCISYTHSTINPHTHTQRTVASESFGTTKPPSRSETTVRCKKKLVAHMHSSSSFWQRGRGPIGASPSPNSGSADKLCTLCVFCVPTARRAQFVVSSCNTLVWGSHVQGRWPSPRPICY